jgi:hypothetical protein
MNYNSKGSAPHGTKPPVTISNKPIIPKIILKNIRNNPMEIENSQKSPEKD